MPDAPPDGPEDKTSEAPAPEVLQPQDDSAQLAAEGDTGGQPGAESGKLGKDGKPEKADKKRRTFRPSHKATFVGLAVVVGILAINAVVFLFILRAQEPAAQPNREEVTISTEELEKLGVNRGSPGVLGTELIVGPDARFNGNVTVANDVDIAGGLTINSRFKATGANLTELQAGKTSLESLNVNGLTTLTDLSVRQDLSVAGVTQLQGAVTVNNNMNVIGNLTVGGSIFAGKFQATALVSGSTLTIGGHVITKGGAPTVSAGGGTGSNGTASISGNDAAGTVAVNVGVGGGNGTLATVTFRTDYQSTPHIVFSPIGRSVSCVYINRSSNGFTIVASCALSTGGYAFDYVVMQ